MTDFKEYENYDGLGLAQLIREKKVTALEVLEAAIEKIETYNPAINAVVYTMFDIARKTLANNSYPSGAFSGVPFLVKDLLLELKGHPTTASSEFLRNHQAQRDSILAKRYQQAGLIIIGKTNTPEFGLLGVTESKMRGPCRNPWNLEFSPGGSSGGSAAAVASGMVPIAHGGDGGGSIRIPASSCGLFGLRPTRGRIPMGPTCSESWLGLVSEHVISRTVRDSAALLDATHGPELGSFLFFKDDVVSFYETMKLPPKKLKIAFCYSLYTDTAHEDCKKALDQTMKLCERLGHEVIEAKPVFNKEEMIKSFLLVMASCCAYELKKSSLEMKKNLQPSEFEPLTWFMKLVGENTSADELVWAQEKNHELIKSADNFFSQYDVLATPTMAFPPPKIGLMDLKAVEKLAMSFIRTFPSKFMLKKMLDTLASTALEKTSNTPFFNQTGFPAMSVPLHWTKENLPIGIQFGTRWAGEALLLQLAHQLEQAQPWNQKRPQNITPLHGGQTLKKSI